VAEGDKNGAKTAYEEGLALAQRATELGPESSFTWKWYAINLGKIGDYIPLAEKIKNSFKVKETALKSRDLDPKDAGIHHLLGTWCFTIANVGWIERKAAATLFATPPTATYTEAEEHLLKAHELDPTLLDTLALLGDCYVAMGGQTDNAKKFYKKALDLPCATSKEKAVHQEIKTKVGKLR